MLYIKLLSKEMKHRLGLLIVSAVAFAILFHLNGYTIGRMEYLYMLFALAACAVILSDDEMDFLIIGHIQLSRVFVIRFIASFLSVAAIPSVWILIFTKERRPMKAVFAFAVTVLIIAAIGAFFRVVLNNTLAAMIFSLITFTVFMFSTELGIFSPFGAMSIASMREFYINRFIWLGISTVLLSVCYILLAVKDKYRL
ncbi:MAG: hypothetical protein IJ489_11170 [Clostridia bacterium]|nr:hypothetical protein [Clostridia bacterium]